MPAVSYSKSAVTPEQISLLKERMSLLADRNPSWSIKRTDWRALWPYFAAQKITYLYDDELFESLVHTDFKITGKGEELLDAYMILEEDHEIQLKLFQWKFSDEWKGGISTKELYAFVDRMNRVFLKTDLQDEQTLVAYREIQAALDAARKGRRRQPRVRVQCYFVTNGQSLSLSDAPKLDQLRDTYANDRQSHGFIFETYSAQDFHHLCVHGRIPIQDEMLEMNSDMGERSFMHHNIGDNPNGMPIQVMVGFVNVNQFVRLVDRYSNNELFEKNVRFFLGPSKEVNRSIIGTVTSHQSSWFGFMNNGVSIVADSVELLPPPSGGRMKLRLTNMQIINGCQTVNALYHAKYDPGLRDRFQGNSNVLVRIYQVDPQNTAFLNALIIATNSQNAIRPEDLLATDPRQTRAQELLAAYGIFYQRKEGEAAPPGSQMLNFSKEQAALAWLAAFKQYTSKLRNSASKREVFREGGDYEDIFSPFAEDFEDGTAMRRRALEFTAAWLIHQAVAAKIDQSAHGRREKGPLRKAAYYLVSGIRSAGEVKLDALLDSLTEAEPSSSAREQLRKVCAGLVDEKFGSLVIIFNHELGQYLEQAGGTEDAALKNSAFAAAFMRAASQPETPEIPGLGSAKS